MPHPFSYVPRQPGRPADPSRPVIWLKLIGPQDSIQLEALVDTGSTATYLDWSLAAHVGATLIADSRRVKWRGLVYDRSFADVRLELTDDHGQVLRWNATVWFWMAQPGLALLGQRDGLLLFDANFRPSLSRLELQPNAEFFRRSENIGNP